MMELTELKPCPFCGGAPRVSNRMDEDLCTHNVVRWNAVSCNECDIEFDIPDGYENGTAAERWNRRANIGELTSPEYISRLRGVMGRGAGRLAESIRCDFEWCETHGWPAAETIALKDRILKLVASPVAGEVKG